jgi:hypothetical protein
MVNSPLGSANQAYLLIWAGSLIGEMRHDSWATGRRRDCRSHRRSAIGVAPAAGAEPLNGSCIAGKMNSDGSCYYANCSEAEAAGECDIAEGSPHYCTKQDRDGDGVACECNTW